MIRFETVRYEAELGAIQAGESRTVGLLDLLRIDGSKGGNQHFDPELSPSFSVHVVADGPDGERFDGGTVFLDPEAF